jgi:hypothetical protein
MVLVLTFQMLLLIMVRNHLMSTSLVLQDKLVIGLPDTYPLYDNAIKTTLSLTTGQTFVLNYFIGSGEGSKCSHCKC